MARRRRRDPYAATAATRFDLIALIVARLAAVAKETPQAFNMDWWMIVKDHACGTAGCAIGLACELPEINAAGLHLEPLRGRTFNGGVAFQPTYTAANGYVFIGFEAVSQALGITTDTAYRLFSAGAYPCSATHWPSAKRVLLRLRAYLRLYGKLSSPKNEATNADAT